MRESFEDVLGLKTAATLLRQIELHYTPTHASCLNIAELEIGVLQRQCLARCTTEPSVLANEVAARQKRRNASRCGIDWTFPRRDADRKLKRHNFSQLTCRFTRILRNRSHDITAGARQKKSTAGRLNTNDAV